MKDELKLLPRPAKVEAVKALKELDFTFEQIAETLGIGVRTAKRYINEQTDEEWHEFSISMIEELKKGWAEEIAERVAHMWVRIDQRQRIPIRQRGVYLAWFPHMFKIGRSKDIRRRFVSMKSANPFIILVGWVATDNPDILEEELHQKFQSKHVGGEWFELDKNDIALIRKQYGFKTVFVV